MNRPPTKIPPTHQATPESVPLLEADTLLPLSAHTAVDVDPLEAITVGLIPMEEFQAFVILIPMVADILIATSLSMYFPALVAKAGSIVQAFS